MDAIDSLFSSQSVGSGMISPDIYVDEEGDWYFQGSQLIRQEIIEFFLENIHSAPGGGFFIQWKQSRCDIHAADTPFVVARVDRNESVGADVLDEVQILLRHSSRHEVLDPRTLRVGKDNVLYCQVRDGRFPARFSRSAYYQLAAWIEEEPETGEFYLELGGVRYKVRMR